MAEQVKYTDDNIRTLEWNEHIRLRPGMYIGKLGDGASPDDGIYILLKEIMDNSIDEFVMGNGRRIEIEINEKVVSVRDFGRGIPLGKVVDCVSKINTGAKYDSEAFKKSVGLNGVGTKAVNALASQFMVQSIREGKTKIAQFEKGVIVNDPPVKADTETKQGTKIEFVPDETIFHNFRYRKEYVEKMVCGIIVT